MHGLYTDIDKAKSLIVLIRVMSTRFVIELQIVQNYLKCLFKLI